MAGGHTDAELHDMADRITAWVEKDFPSFDTFPPWLTRFIGLLCIRMAEDDPNLQEMSWGMICGLIMAYRGYNPLTFWIDTSHTGTHNGGTTTHTA